MKAHLILYVKDQDLATRFYAAVLDAAPALHVPGMTEFALNGETVLGLMPESGIRRLLGDAIADPAKASGIPRAEIYLHVERPEVFHERALKHGARELSAPAPRDWGDVAAYSLDPDGHVLAFAKTVL